jgi:hypothetical protein
MNIQTSYPVRPTVVRAAAVATASDTAPLESFVAGDSSQGGLLKGPLGRAIYGAALYGLPSIAGATMGINGVIPGALVGAGIGAATHLQNSGQAAVFGATGAVVGAAAAYVGFLGAAYGFKLQAVAITAALGAGSQALFALTQEK